MKRDMDLIRVLLMAIEEHPAGDFLRVSNDVFPEYEDAVLRGHMQLLDQAGFVANVTMTRGSVVCGDLTWEGHEFLSLSRTSSFWKQAKTKIASIGGSTSVEVIKQVLQQIALANLGMG